VSGSGQFAEKGQDLSRREDSEVPANSHPKPPTHSPASSTSGQLLPSAAGTSLPAAAMKPAHCPRADGSPRRSCPEKRSAYGWVLGAALGLGPGAAAPRSAGLLTTEKDPIFTPSCKYR